MPRWNADRCGNCRFHSTNDKGDGSPLRYADAGYCMRHSPSAIGAKAANFPFTSVNEWCGDYERRLGNHTLPMSERPQETED